MYVPIYCECQNINYKHSKFSICIVLSDCHICVSSKKKKGNILINNNSIIIQGKNHMT